MFDVYNSPNSGAVPRIKSCALEVQLAISKLSKINIKYCVIAALGLSISTGVAAQQIIEIISQPLVSAIRELAQQTGLQILYNAESIDNQKSNNLKGIFSREKALQKLLRGSDLEAIRQSNGSYVIKKITDGFNNGDIVGTLALTTVETKNRFGDTPKEKGGFKAEYQTTATKMAMSLRETPQAISVITRDALDARLVKDISTAIEFSAGASTGDTGAPGPFGGRGQYGTMYSLRGQNLDYYGGVLSDGFTVSSLNELDFSAYERVEVMKGPSGFYGQGSLGGFINLVRKKPQAEFGSNISTQIGSYDTYRLDADVTGALNENKSIRGRITMGSEHSGSFVSGVDSDMLQLAPSLELDINQNTSALVQLLYQKDNYIANQGLPLQLKGNKLESYDLSRSFFFGAGTQGDESENEVFDALVKVEHEISDRWLATIVLQNNASIRNTVMSNGGSLDDGFAYLDASEHLTDYDRWSGEFRLQGAFDAFGYEHKILLGAERSQKKLNVLYNYVELGISDLYADNFSEFGLLSENDIPDKPHFKSKNNTEVIYLQSVLKLHERTQLLINARYDRVDIKGAFRGVENTPYKNDVFTYRVGLTQEFNDNISGYVSYAESFDPIDSMGQDGEFLKPETGEGYEFGFKSDWFNNKLGASLAVYRQELNNSPITDPDNRDFEISAGLHRTDGIELEISGSPLPGLTLAIAVDWSDNEYLEKDDPNVGLSYEGSVNNHYSFFASYEIQQGLFKGLGMGATIVSVGDRQFIGEGEDDFGNEDIFQTYLEGYERVDLNFSYDVITNVSINLLVRNVLDKNYIEGSGGGTWGSNYYGSPRAVLLNASYSF